MLSLRYAEKRHAKGCSTETGNPSLPLESRLGKRPYRRLVYRPLIGIICNGWEAGEERKGLSFWRCGLFGPGRPRVIRVYSVFDLVKNRFVFGRRGVPCLGKEREKLIGGSNMKSVFERFHDAG